MCSSVGPCVGAVDLVPNRSRDISCMPGGETFFGEQERKKKLKRGQREENREREGKTSKNGDRDRSKLSGEYLCA